MRNTTKPANANKVCRVHLLITIEILLVILPLNIVWLYYTFDNTTGVSYLHCLIVYCKKYVQYISYKIYFLSFV